MLITVLALHRKEAYDGQCAPEILAVCDEVTMDDNPDWWATEVARVKESVGGDASAWAELTLDVDTDAIMEALYPARKKVAAPVVGTRHHGAGEAGRQG